MLQLCVSLRNLYTVDRSKSLSVGTTYYLESGKLNSKDAQYLNQGFSEGLPKHGESYLLLKMQGNVEPQVGLRNAMMLEMLFENIRSTKYAYRPSRLQSMFAVDSLDSAKKFVTGQADIPIYRVEAQIVFKADMNLLNSGGGGLSTLKFCELYWLGQPHPTREPFWEYLLRCPVTVCERVA